MTRPGLVLALLVVFTPSAQALVLLDPDPSEATARVRVEEPPLRAQALEANGSLGGTTLGPEPETVSAKLEDWRGFENTTLVAADGPGAVLVADGVSGIVLDPDDPPATNGTEPNANGTSPLEEPPRTTRSSSPDGSNGLERRPSSREGPGEAPSGEPGPPTTSEDEASPGDDDGGREWPTPAVLLGLVAVGAIGVEAWQRVSGPGDDR